MQLTRQPLHRFAFRDNVTDYDIVKNHPQLLCCSFLITYFFAYMYAKYDLISMTTLHFPF